MKKKIIGILVMMLLIGIAIIPSISGLKLNNFYDDQVDQQQTEIDFCKEPSDTWCLAQSFKPTLPILTRVELMVSGSCKCSIRSDLGGLDLTSVTESFPSPPHDWQFFDFPDITVTPESTYYIVLIPQNTDASVCGAYDTDYIRGCMYFSEDGGATWGEPLDEDMQFKTYGTTEDCDRFMGLCVEPLGDASLDIGDELRVYNLDDVGDDGVMVDLEAYNTYTCSLENPFEPNLETAISFKINGMNGEEPLWMGLQLRSDGTGRMEKALSNAQAAQRYNIIGFGPDDDIVIKKEIEEISDLGFVEEDISNNNLQFSGIYCAMCPQSWIGQSIVWQHPVQWTWDEHDVYKLTIKKFMIKGIIKNVEAESYISDSSICSTGIDDFTVSNHYAYVLDPPAEPGIDGQTEGNSGKSYDYDFNNIGTSDVYFIIDWDDGSEIEYTDLTSPGVTKTIGHTWTADGTYVVKACSMNEWGMMSEWVTLEVSMPRNRVISSNFLLQKLLKNYQFFFLLF